ncbi:MAG: DUF6785 family protein [Gemmatimonadota bacterium]
MGSFLTWRAALWSAALIAAGAWLAQRVELVHGGPALASGALGALPVLALAMLAGLAARVPARLRLSQGELAAVYLAAAIGLPLATSGLCHYLLPALVTGFYQFADPAGRYHPFLRFIPDWMVPGREGSQVVDGLFEGGMQVPWGAWVGPLTWWAALAASVALVLWGVAAALRQRWLEEERLRLPMADLPRELAARGAELLGNRLTAVGALVPALVYGINGLHHYFQVPGEIPLAFDLSEVLVDQPWSAMAPYTSRFAFEVSPMLVGMAFLMSLEVSFSTWLFFLLTRLQLLAAELAGRSADQGVFVGLGGQWREWPNFFPHLQAQARGGILCLAVLSLWSARHSLGRFARRAAGGARAEAAALGCLGVGAAGIAAWSAAAGLSIPLSLLHLALMLLTAVGVTRLRVDGGAPVAGLHFLTANLLFFAAGTGPEAFAPQAYVGLAFLSLLSYTGLLALLPIQLEGIKLAEDAGAAWPRVGAVLALGLGLGLLAGFWTTLDLFYARGLFALDQHGGARAAARVGRYVHYLYAEAGTQSAGADLARLAAAAFGGLVTAGVVAARAFFLRLPLHPVGFVYGTALGSYVWGSVLAGWAAKSLAVRYGGARTYQRLRPFFLGLILGELAMRLVWGAASLTAAPGAGYAW